MKAWRISNSLRRVDKALAAARWCFWFVEMKILDMKVRGTREELTVTEVYGCI